MESGIALAINEITLVVFTTLAPSGVVALCLMLAASLVASASPEEETRISQYSCIPLIVSMVGLLMSATHLGNPGNVLYVFARVGHSPLSSEVFAAAAFLALAGVYWLYSFAQKPHEVVRRVWVVCLCIAGAVFLGKIAVAYAAPSIITWNTPYVPVALVLNALVGGPVLALLSLRAARASFARGRFAAALLTVSAVALLANVGVCVAQNAQLPFVANELAQASDLVPFYGFAIGAFAACGVAGIALTWVVRNRAGKRAFAVALGACALMFAGIFATRFCFYAMHLTVGLGM